MSRKFRASRFACHPIVRIATGLVAVAAIFGCATNRLGFSDRDRTAPLTLIAGADHRVESGIGDAPCSNSADLRKEEAVDAALSDAVSKVLVLRDLRSGTRPVEFVSAHVVLDTWYENGRCFARVQAAVDTERIRHVEAAANRTELRSLGRPTIAFAIETFRVLPNLNVTTRRSAAEIIDSLQQEFIVRGFDVRRSLKARNEALQEGGDRVDAISSAERSEIAAAALKDGVDFLVQGEVKVSDEGEQPDGRFLAVVDGSFEAVDLRSEHVVGAFRNVASGKHVSATAAYTKALSELARLAVGDLSPQMLDTWQNRESHSQPR